MLISKKCDRYFEMEVVYHADELSQYLVTKGYATELLFRAQCGRQ